MSGPALGRTVQDGEPIQALGLGFVHTVNATSNPTLVGPFDSLTTVVRIEPKVTVCIRTGKDDTVVADTGDSEFIGKWVEFIKVEPGGYLSVVKAAGSADGQVKITEST